MNSPRPPGSPAGRIRPPEHRPFARCRPVTVYEKIDKIGQGTFGEVFKGKEKETGELVALKKVLMKNEQEGFPLTALREIRILKVLNHPNVLSLKEIVHTQASDYNRQKGSIYMVSEFMDHDLGGLLNRGVQFKVPEIMCLTKQLLEGLHYIHVQRILHRDMKVANLLLNKKGILKIADFGLARGIVENSKYTSTVCTRWYRPPELLLGERFYTPAIDIWGVGCIVAELFTGRPILQGGVAGAKTEAENDFDQYVEICKLCGTPKPEVWADLYKLPNAKLFQLKEEYKRALHTRFRKTFRIPCEAGIKFVDDLLALDPKKRPTASEALDHDFLWSDPSPCDPEQIQHIAMECHEWKVPPKQSRISKPKQKSETHHEHEKRQQQQSTQQSAQQHGKKRPGGPHPPRGGPHPPRGGLHPPHHHRPHHSQQAGHPKGGHPGGSKNGHAHVDHKRKRECGEQLPVKRPKDGP